MRSALAEVEARAQKLSTAVGWISFSIGVALTLSPGGIADSLGWDRRERSARLVGAADLAVRAGPLLARRRSRWMLARAVLNVVIAGIYAQALANGTPRRKRALGGVCLMTGLTVNDYYLSRCLTAAEASYNLARTR